MNAYPSFVTDIDGQTIHFLHVRSAEDGATPLLLLHTYPGSFAEFLDMIGPLTAPVAHGGRAEDAFHVVVPSMPGVGFSTPLSPAVDGGDWTMAKVARAYDALMRRLGYQSYGTHGSDGGAMVSRELAVLDPDGFLGAHVLQLFSFPSGAEGEFDAFGPKEYAALEFLGWFQSVGGYNGMNGTRPQTIAAALSDSPVGQLAYNELFESFGNGTSLVSAEQVLTQVSLYWLTNSSAAAVRYHYAEGHSGAAAQVSHGRTGVAVFKDDFQTIRPLAERDNTNIVHWTEFDRGGHYAAMEVPELVVEDLRTFFA
jgi:pimeloyl-ACP methyl ester carboxylesterase